jgi:hypothetical protein
VVCLPRHGGGEKNHVGATEIRRYAPNRVFFRTL